jgi:hypothetical protein
VVSKPPTISPGWEDLELSGFWAGKSVTSLPQKPQCAAPMGLKASQRPQTIPTSSDPSAMSALFILSLPPTAKRYRNDARPARGGRREPGRRAP